MRRPACSSPWSRRHPADADGIAADVTLGDLRLGQHAEAIIDCAAESPQIESRALTRVTLDEVAAASRHDRRNCRTVNAHRPAGPTIKDVAAAAGVSRSTASRALSGNGYAAPEVREKVRAVARELGYVVDVTAR